MLIQPKPVKRIDLQNTKAMALNLVHFFEDCGDNMNLSFIIGGGQYRVDTIDDNQHFEIYKCKDNSIVWEKFGGTMRVGDRLEFCTFLLNFSEEKIPELEQDFEKDMEMNIKWFIDNTTEEQKDLILLSLLKQNAGLE